MNVLEEIHIGVGVGINNFEVISKFQLSSLWPQARPSNYDTIWDYYIDGDYSYYYLVYYIVCYALNKIKKWR